MHRCLPFELFILFILYPVITSTAFKAFECEDFSDGTSWLVADYAIQCSYAGGETSSDYVPVIALGVISLLLWPIGVPAASYALLRRCKAAIQSGKPSPLSQATRFLHRPYEPRCYYWELVEIMRKLLLVGFARVGFFKLSEVGSTRQLLFGTMVSLCHLLFVAMTKPFKDVNDDYLATGCSFMLVCFFIMCLICKVGDLTDLLAYLSPQYQRQYRTDPVFLIAALMVIIFGGLVVLVLMMFAEIRAEREKQRVLTKDEMAALLAVVKGDQAGRQASRSGVGGGSLRKMKTGVFKSMRSVHAGLLQMSADPSASKFGAANRLITGQHADAVNGLMDYMGCDDPASAGAAKIEREWLALRDSLHDDETVAALRPHARMPDRDASLDEARAFIVAEISSWIQYVLYDQTSEAAFHNGMRDGGRGSVDLAHFLEHEHAKQAGLKAGHVVALRIYTTHLFKYLNGPLRDQKTFGKGLRPHPLPVTMMFISEGIKKLRAVYLNRIKESEEKVARLYRGMRNLDVTDDFMKDRAGGTEVAPMSTTTDIRVAVHYGLSPGSLLFMIKVDNFMQYGAELRWLSAFPGEAEVCFPPLTFLQPTGRTELIQAGENVFKVVECVPHLP